MPIDSLRNLPSRGHGIESKLRGIPCRVSPRKAINERLVGLTATASLFMVKFAQRLVAARARSMMPGYPAPLRLVARNSKRPSAAR